MAVTAKVDCRVCVISTLYETKQATLPRQNNQIHFGFGKNFFISVLYVYCKLLNKQHRIRRSG